MSLDDDRLRREFKARVDELHRTGERSAARSVEAMLEYIAQQWGLCHWIVDVRVQPLFGFWFGWQWLNWRVRFDRGESTFDPCWDRLCQTPEWMQPCRHRVNLLEVA